MTSRDALALGARGNWFGAGGRACRPTRGGDYGDEHRQRPARSTDPVAVLRRGRRVLAGGVVAHPGSCALVAPSMAVGSGFEVDWQMMAGDPPRWSALPHASWRRSWRGRSGSGRRAAALHARAACDRVCGVVALRMGAGFVGALLVGAAVALTAPTQMCKLHWNGYTDPICYTLFLWMILAARTPWLFWTCS